MFYSGQYHAPSLQTYIIIPTVLVAALILLVERKRNKTFFATVAFLVSTSILYGFYKWNNSAMIVDSLMKIVPIQLDRFHWLHSVAWHILFASGLSFLLKKSKHFRLPVVLLLMLQLTYTFKNHELWVNRKHPSYKAFFAKDLFKEIQTFINRPTNSYKVACLGLHPAIAQFNGFYT